MRIRRLFALAAIVPFMPRTSLLAQPSNTQLLQPAGVTAGSGPSKPCASGQVAYQKPDGQWTCVAPNANPCAKGQIFVVSASGVGTCKPNPAPPVKCANGQVAYQKPDGQWACVSPTSNPCGSHQILVVSASGLAATCKQDPTPPVKCAVGMVAFQNPDGKWTCVSPPCPCGWKAAPPNLVPTNGSACTLEEASITCPQGTRFFREGNVIGCRP